MMHLAGSGLPPGPDGYLAAGGISYLAVGGLAIWSVLIRAQQLLHQSSSQGGIPHTSMCILPVLWNCLQSLWGIVQAVVCRLGRTGIWEPQRASATWPSLAWQSGPPCPSYPWAPADLPVQSGPPAPSPPPVRRRGPHLPSYPQQVRPALSWHVLA